MYGATFAYPSLLPPQVGRGRKEAGIQGLEAINKVFFHPFCVRNGSVQVYSVRAKPNIISRVFFLGHFLHFARVRVCRCLSRRYGGGGGEEGKKRGWLMKWREGEGLSSSMPQSWGTQKVSQRKRRGEGNAKKG